MNQRNTPVLSVALLLTALTSCQSAGTGTQPSTIPSIRSEMAAAPGEFWRDVKGTFTSKHNLFLLGGALLVAVALGIWGYGHGSGNVRTHEAGSRAIAALAATGAITQVIKTIVPEKRPNGGNGSFPSGHSSMSFAFADTMRRSYGWKVGVPLYVVATGVALQRLDASWHELEDVVVGAALGLAVSRTVHLRRGAEAEEAVLSIGPYVNDANGAVGLSVSLDF